MTSMMERGLFWSKALIESDTRLCWLWQDRLQPNGYGQCKKNAYAHRAAYEYERGPIPAGLEIDHTCNVRHCVNPWHMEPVTHEENMARARKRRDRCKRGHPFYGRNLYLFWSGTKMHRMCRECRRKNMSDFESRRCRK